MNSVSKIPIKIKAHYDNLGFMLIKLRYYQDAAITRRKDDSATFEFLLNSEKHEIIKSSRKAFEIEGTPDYPLGFLPELNSQGKIYNGELSLRNGGPKDTLLIFNGPDTLVSGYKITKENLKAHPIQSITNIIISKIIFIFTQNQARLVSLSGIFIPLAMFFFYRFKKNPNYTNN